MKTLLKLTTIFLVVLSLVGVVLHSGAKPDQQEVARTTGDWYYHASYHHVWSPPAPANRPLPAPESAASGVAMTAAATAMNDAARLMEAVVPALALATTPIAASFATHWRLDAGSLRAQAAWMVETSTSDGMIHDPSHTYAVNLRNLEANGDVMVTEGQNLARHGRAMQADVDTLGATRSLTVTDVAALATAAQALISAGERLERDGARMQDAARDTLVSLGR
jgi:hypothetical protein